MSCMRGSGPMQRVTGGKSRLRPHAVRLSAQRAFCVCFSPTTSKPAVLFLLSHLPVLEDHVSASPLRDVEGRSRRIEGYVLVRTGQFALLISSGRLTANGWSLETLQELFKSPVPSHATTSAKRRRVTAYSSDNQASSSVTRLQTRPGFADRPIGLQGVEKEPSRNMDSENLGGAADEETATEFKRGPASVACKT